MAVISKVWAEAQRAVIGSLMISPDEVSGIVFLKATPGMFGDPAMRHVFESARSLWSAGKPIDAVTVLSVAGDEYHDLIEGCMRMTPTAANVEAYLDEIRNEAQLAAMQEDAMAILSAKTIEDAMDAFERIGIRLRETKPAAMKSMSQMISEYLDRMNDPTPPDYLRFGIEKLDDAIAVTRGMYIILGAESSSGKTALALQFAVNLAKTGKRVGFFSLETPDEPMQNRIMSETQVAGIKQDASKHKQLTDMDFLRAMEAGIAFENTQLYFGRTANTVEAIRAETVQHRFDVIFIDYVQLVASPGESRTQIVTETSIRLHNMAQELNVTIVGLSQMTPPDKNVKRKLTVDDLRESRQLRNDAEIVLLLSKSEDKNDPKHLRILEVGKNKDGRHPRIKLNFDPEHMTFWHYKDMSDIYHDGEEAKARSGQATSNHEHDELPL